MALKETPVETFKRSLAQTTRALAGREEELEVAFGAEGPRLSPGKIVLPHPPRVISDPEAERIRGQADALALRLAHHNDKQHASLRPGGAEARLVFDAVEDMQRFGDSTDASPDHGSLRRHRFQHAERVPLRKRRRDNDVRCLQKRRNIVTMACERDAARDAEALRHREQATVLRPIAREQEVDARYPAQDLRCSGENEVVALHACKASDHQHETRFRCDSQSSTGACASIVVTGVTNIDPVVADAQ
jgi:cobalamin biosynthesis protein CobT